MLKLILNRVKVLIPMLILISILSFGLLELAPGDPADAYINPLMSSQDIENIRVNMGLDKPVYIRYLNWLKNTLSGNLGISYINHMPVTEQIMEKMGNTFILMGTSLIFSILVAIPLGILLAVNKNSITSKVSSVFNYIGVSIPSFWIGMILISIFSVKLNIFPSGGMHTIGNDSIGDLVKHLVLPVITLGLYNTAIFTNYVEASVNEQLKKQYVITARAKGLSEKVILFKHVLKNSLTSLVTILGMSIQKLVTGAFVTEVVFSWPGMGRLMIDSIFSRDYTVIMAITMLSALFLILGNLVADILYLLIDPKIKSSKGGF
ncbi:TPA: ABC transporter permease [Clostridioides difficile]|uniref:ABC transporter oligopeptide-family permease n=2 Tax=Clostridioides difficile TaxID=1496 RepID=A0AB74Q5L5_CLODI|nr:ABC transporter permease [Clostridioides difficile]AKP43632.1 oligopeptide ABC transporter permease [Clostridioides difficile ATCC 9689 = DSM 1296]ARC16160.1 ABC transporter permease [Clostridioides difficile]AVI13181.1 ABC transporter permease [Clostridioides difficile]AXU87628.1 oligopeptide ABC transporter permease [Clostridioides difficile]EGT3640852.1 ABC transporter permease [Clostridioides difficile]